MLDCAVEFERTLPATPRPSGAESSAAPGELPSRIARYLVQGVLGEGGMGIVYAAFDEELERKVAIKVLRSADARSQARMRREAQALAQLSHPNVIHVYEVGSWSDQLYIAMEYVEGQTLREWIAAESRTSEEILAAFVQAGAGLQAAHAAGIVHRDFKADNVMIEGDGRVRVLDFGLAGAGVDEAREEARPVSESPRFLNAKLTDGEQLMGTLAYMSPEQFNNSRVGPASDQFSFCVSLYEALYGERPFAGERATAAIANMMQGKVREAPGDTQVSEGLRAVLLRGLAVEPGARHADMGALLAELGAQRPPAFSIGALLPVLASACTIWAVLLKIGPLGLEATEPIPIVVELGFVILVLLGSTLLEMWGLVWLLARFSARRGLYQLVLLTLSPLLGLHGLVALTSGSSLLASAAWLKVAGLGLGVALPTYLAAPAVLSSRSRAGVMGWALLAGIGAPLLVGLCGVELGLVRHELIYCLAPFIGVPLLIAPSWLGHPTQRRARAWLSRLFVLLTAAATPAVIGLLYGYDLHGFGRAQQLATLASEARVGSAPPDCACEGCSPGTWGWGGYDSDSWVLNNDSGGWARVGFATSGIPSSGLKLGGSKLVDPGVPHFIKPGSTRVDVLREPGMIARDYCLATTLEALPSSVNSSEAQPESWLGVHWRRASSQADWRASLSGQAPPGAGIVVELPGKILFEHRSSLPGFTLHASEEELEAKVLRSWTFEADADSGRWSGELWLPRDELGRTPKLEFRSVLRVRLRP